MYLVQNDSKNSFGRIKLKQTILRDDQIKRMAIVILRRQLI